MLSTDLGSTIHLPSRNDTAPCPNPFTQSEDAIELFPPLEDPENVSQLLGP